MARRFFLLLPLLGVGCGNGPTTLSVSDSPKAERTPVEQTHRLGVVRPGAIHSHQFEITNTADVPWTFELIRAGCTCTVDRVTREVVPPGESTLVDVSYTAGHRPADERRTVDIRFKEPSAPLVVLALEAVVRDPLTVTPWEIALREDADGRAASFLRVLNHSGRNWKGLSTETDCDWLAVDTVPVPLDGKHADDDPRQVWRVTLNANVASLPPGSHTARLRFRPVGDGEPAAGDGKLSGDAVVTISIDQTFRVTPPVLFFGEIAAHETTERTLQVAMKGNITQGQPRLRHDLTGQLTVTEQPGETGRSRRLLVRLHPDGVARTIDGTLTITGPDGSSVDVPVRSLVRQDKVLAVTGEEAQ